MVAAKALPLLVDPLLVANPGTTSSLVKFIAFSVTESLRFAKDEAFKRKPVVDSGDQLSSNRTQGAAARRSSRWRSARSPS